MTDDRVTDLLALISAFEPTDEKAAASRAKMLSEIPTMQRPFDEDASPVHVTASAVLMSSAGFLLHKHKRLGIWVGPGGHIEAEETPDGAVLREASEETGLTPRHPLEGPLLIHVDVHSGAKGHTHFDLRWLLIADPDHPNPGEGESSEVGWYSLAEASARVPEDYVFALHAAQAHRPLG